MRTRMQTGMIAAAFTLVAVQAGSQPARSAGEAHSSASGYIDTRNGMSLDEAIAQALDREPTLQAVRGELEATKGMRMQAGLRSNPTVSFERREEPAGTDNQTTAQVQWPLELFRREPRIAVAERDIEVSEHAVDDQVRTLAGDVRLRYGQAAAAIREAAVAEDMTEVVRQSYDLVRQRVEEGAAPPLDRDQMQVELRRLEAERLLAAGRADAAMFALKQTLGLPAKVPLALRNTLETLAPSPLADSDPGGDVVGAVSRETPFANDRADLREAEARVRLAESRIGMARADGRFDISLFGSYSRMDAGFPQRGFAEHGEAERVHGVFNYVSAGALVTLPLWNRHQGDVAAAIAERSAAAARLEAARLNVDAEVAAAIAQDTQTRRALAFTQSNVELARRNLDVARQTYELGGTAASDVLAAQRRYLEVERAHTDTLRAAYEARVALLRARGEQ